MSRNTNLSAAKNAKNDEFRADVIVTNPPFSLFREFLAWIVEGDEVAAKDAKNAKSAVARDARPYQADTDTLPDAAVGSRVPRDRPPKKFRLYDRILIRRRNP